MASKLQHTTPSGLCAGAARLLGQESWSSESAALLASAAGCRLHELDGTTFLDLTASDGGLLLGAAHPRVTEALAVATETGLTTATSLALGIAVASRLQDDFAGTERVVFTESHSEALQLAVDRARALTERELVARAEPCCGIALHGPLVIVADVAELEARLPEVGAVVIAPITDAPLPRDRLVALCARARQANIPVIADECDSAYRIARRGAQHELGVTADLTVLGSSIAAGLPLGAVLGSAALLDSVSPGWRASALSLAAAAASLDELATAPVFETIARTGERLRQTFDTACQAHQIHARLVGPPGRMTLVFDGQENADAARIHRAFVDELRGAKVVVGRHVRPTPGIDDAVVGEVEAALTHATARVRTLLIELNSFICGGLPWVFGDAADPRLGERGLAIYRFPLHGPVDVTAHRDHIRITVAPGDLGEVTSSGFYLPTRLRGNFTVSLRYRLPHWQPGPNSACVALFAQDEASVLRYYSQRRSAGNRPHEVLGNFNNTDLTTPRPIEATAGAFRLERRGDVVSAFHRGANDNDWIRLGEHRGDPRNDVIVGSKIWSSGIADGLEAELYDLEIEAEIPAEQLAPVPVRPDPRGA